MHRLYRRNCLKALKLDLNEELDYLDGFSKENPKNYQIWHHRRTIVEWLGKGDRELAFCESVFEVDAKNYHAWAHRLGSITIDKFLTSQILRRFHVPSDSGPCKRTICGTRSWLSLKHA